MPLFPTTAKLVELTDEFEKQTKPCRRHRPRADSCLHCASRLLAVCAVAEATGCGQLDEITEDEIDRKLKEKLAKFMNVTDADYTDIEINEPTESTETKDE